MNQSDFNDEILRNIGGKSKNNLNEILNNFTDTDFEIDTFSESPFMWYWLSKWTTYITRKEVFNFECEYTEYKCYLFKFI